MRLPTLLPLLALALLAPAKGLAAWPPSPEKQLTRDDLASPLNWPNDPDYRKLWHLWGFVPLEVQNNPSFRSSESLAGAGINADRAWQLSIGNRRTAVAVTDGGFNWSNRDMANKWRLSRGELPPPQDATGNVCATCPDPWDVNGDGGFTAGDFTGIGRGQVPTPGNVTDRRLLARPDRGDVNGNGLIDPQDLIAVFANNADDDHNGYADDICGWDFLWNDPDVGDDVGNGAFQGSHGDLTARHAAAEGNNGEAGVGVCPECTLLPLRVSDSFVVDANRYADAVLYATDNGAASLLGALASTTNTPLVQKAIDYAYARGVPIFAASADETSYHHNYPASLERIMAVSALLYNGSGFDAADTTSYIAFNNCSNWGGHVFLTLPAKECASQATSMSGGFAGLIKAYASDLGLEPPLSAQETYALMTDNADDIYVPESLNRENRIWPSGPGWDPNYGYGRANAFRALDALRAGRVPPELDITSPLWFEVLDPNRGPVAIRASVDARRAQGGFEWTVEYGLGLAPRGLLWKRLAGGSSTAPIEDAVLAELPVSLEMFGPNKDPTRPPVAAHDYAVTVRIRAVAHYGGAVGDVSATVHKTLFVHRDRTLRDSFPVNLGSSGEASPKVIDLDGDGRDEIVLATSDGRVHALDAEGRERPGFPAQVGRLEQPVSHVGRPVLTSGEIDFGSVRETIAASPAVGDLDRDGRPEIVVATLYGAIWAFDARGRTVAGFPVRIPDTGVPCFKQTATGCIATGLVDLPDQGGTRQREGRELERGLFSSPVLADLDGDQRLEIVQAGMDGLVHVYRFDGSAQPGFPIEVRDPNGGMTSGVHLMLRARMISTPAVGDADGDGRPEILVGTNEIYDGGSTGRAYLLRSTGAPTLARSAEAIVPGWPVRLKAVGAEVLPFLGRGHPASPVMLDVDRDGRIDLLEVQTITGMPEFYDATGRRLLVALSEPFGGKSNSVDFPAVSSINSGAAGDLDGDGLLDFANGLLGFRATMGAMGGKMTPYDHTVGVWMVGRLWHENRESLGQPGTPVVDVPFVRGFPQVVHDYQFLSNYLFVDVDGNGKPEVVGGNGGYTLHAFDWEGVKAAGWPKFTGGWNMSTPAVGDLDGDGYLDLVAMTREGWLWSWRLGGRADQGLAWESFHHDAQNTGATTTPLPKRKGPSLTLGTVPAEEGCGCASSGSAALAFLVVPALLVALRPRR